jgi:hypothetical protein
MGMGMMPRSLTQESLFGSRQFGAVTGGRSGPPSSAAPGWARHGARPRVRGAGTVRAYAAPICRQDRCQKLAPELAPDTAERGVTERIGACKKARKIAENLH